MKSEVSERRHIADLLLLLSRVVFTEEEKLKADEVCRKINDWRLFTDLAVRHGVAALVWQNLIDLELACNVSDPEKEILEGIRLRVIARVTYITATTTWLVDELEKKGIKVILLKGLALEYSEYGSRGLRQMSDADILVAPENALRAREILLDLGFTSAPLKSSLYNKIILDMGNHLPELHRSGISVDVHFSLFGPHARRITQQALNFPGEVDIRDKKYSILPPGVAFLSMIEHLKKHENKGEFQLRLYTDIYLLLNNNQTEILTGYLLSEAKEAGIEPDVERVLQIMRGIFGVEIPESFLNCNNKGNLIDKFFNYLDKPGNAESLSQRERYSITLRSLHGIKRKLIFITGDLFPSVQFMKNRYGCSTWFGCLINYPHRLGKLIWIFRILLRG